MNTGESFTAEERFADTERGEYGSYKDRYVRDLEGRIAELERLAQVRKDDLELTAADRDQCRAKLAELERENARLRNEYQQMNDAVGLAHIELSDAGIAPDFIVDRVKLIIERAEYYKKRAPNEPNWRLQSAETILRAWLHQYGSTDGLSISTRAWLSGKRPQFETSGSRVDQLERALLHLSLYVAANGDTWVQETARKYLSGVEPPTRESIQPAKNTNQTLERLDTFMNDIGYTPKSEEGPL